MRFFQLAYKNLLRRKIRTTLTVGGVAVAVAVLVSLMGFNNGYQNALESDVDRLGYQMLVTAKGCPYEAATMMLSGGADLRYMNEATAATITSDPRVSQSLPQLIHAVFDPDRSATMLYMGVTDAYPTLKPWMTFKEGGWFTSTGAPQVVLGYEAAELDQRHVGDSIFVPGTESVLEVVGIFERSGTQDDGIAFMRIETLRGLFPRLEGKLTGIGLKLNDIGDMAALEEDLYSIPEIQVVSMAQVKATIMGLVSSAKILVMSVVAIALTVAAIGVINTILMSVFERTQEVGILKAMGASRMDIFRLIWSETLLICGMGGVIGSLLALIGGSVVELFIRQALSYSPNGHIVTITPQLLVFSIVGAALLGVVAGIYPAIRAASMRPIEAIRSGE